MVTCCVMWPLCFCPSAAHSLLKQSVLNGHLYNTVTNFWSSGWPLKTDLTVLYSRILPLHFCETDNNYWCRRHYHFNDVDISSDSQLVEIHFQIFLHGDAVVLNFWGTSQGSTRQIHTSFPRMTFNASFQLALFDNFPSFFSSSLNFIEL
jgi:hypothetical protein